MMKHLILAIVIGLLGHSGLAAASQSSRSDTATGAVTWETAVDGVSFSLTQILPDQARAFYVNRGFSLQQIEAYAVSCVYMTVLRNDSAAGVIHYISHDWQVSVDQRRHDLVPVDRWIERLAAAGAGKAALIAFRWAQFPAEQEYEPGGDWNQGMLSVGLPAGSRFDISARWDIAGKPHRAELEGVQCAE